MAKLSAFTRDAKAMREGAWINPGDEYGFQIKAKAMGAAYSDRRADKMRAVARNTVGGESKVKSEDRNKIDIESLCEVCLLDVRGLEHDDGRPVTIAEFKQMILQPEYTELAVISFQCAGQVGQTNAALIEQAEGNSLTGSSTTSNGLTTET